MSTDGELLRECMQAVAGWTNWNVTRGYRDPYGRYAFQAKHRDTAFLVVAKQYAHNNLASFMRKVVERALDRDMMLVFMTGPTPVTLADAHVFHPRTVALSGRDSQGNSAQDVYTDWVEIDLGYGCLLGDYVTEHDSPQLPNHVDTGPGTPTGLSDY